MFKKILIPVAALAITATSVSAFTGTDWMSKVDISLTDTEKTALTEAETIREEANTKAKEVLTKAGISENRMGEIREAMHTAREAEHKAVRDAIVANDYEAFKTAVTDSPLASEIDSEAKFAKLVGAHKLREAGDKDGAKAIMDELGIKGFGQFRDGQGGHRGDRGDRPEATETTTPTNN